MLKVEYFDGPALYRWLQRAVTELVARRTEINKLNVFPVPDADTGSNMAHTMEAALAEVEQLPETDRDDITKLTAAIAMGSVRGARGNSGLVLSQVLRGLAQSAVADHITGRTVQEALTMASTFVNRAIIEPVEGTVVTVLRAAAIAANQATTDSLIDVLTAATTAAQIALAKTPSQLAVLRDAGVVDAGAKGLVLLLETMLDEVSGGTVETSTNTKPETEPTTPSFQPQPTSHITTPGSIDMFSQLMGAHVVGTTKPTPQEQPKHLSPFGQPAQLAQLWRHEPQLEPATPTTPITPAAPTEPPRTRADYLEVMFFIQEADLDHIREQLQPLGDSFIIAPIGPHSASVHIHSHQAGPVIETAYRLGKVSNLHLEALPEATTTLSRIVIALTPAGLLAQLYQSAGAMVINPGDDIVLDIAAQARATGASEIILLPNGMLNKQQLASIERSSHAFEQAMTIVPTGMMVRGLAALNVHDSAQPMAVDAYTMGEASQTMRTAYLIAEDGQNHIHVISGTERLCTTDTIRQAVAQAVEKLIADDSQRVTVLVDETAPDFAASDLPKFQGVEMIVYRAQNLGSLVEIGVE